MERDTVRLTVLVVPEMMADLKALAQARRTPPGQASVAEVVRLALSEYLERCAGEFANR